MYIRYHPKIAVWCASKQGLVQPRKTLPIRCSCTSYPSAGIVSSAAIKRWAMQWSWVTADVSVVLVAGSAVIQGDI